MLIAVDISDFDEYDYLYLRIKFKKNIKLNLEIPREKERQSIWVILMEKLLVLESVTLVTTVKVTGALEAKPIST